MRLKTTLLIIMIVFLSTAATFVSGLYFTNESLQETMEKDLTFAIGIADSLVSTQMKLMKAEAAAVALRLEPAGSGAELAELVEEQFHYYPDISALSVFDRNGVIAGYSEPMHDHSEPSHGKYMEMVYSGKTIISSPFHCPTRGDFVLNVYTPMSGGRILSVTMPGMIFSNMLAGNRLWRTGDIFMLNEDGAFIGAADEDIVSAMQNYMADGSTAGTRTGELGSLIQNILSSDNGVEIYSFNGVEHLCAYSRIKDSLLGWRVAVAVPLRESPQAYAMRGQAYSAVFVMIIGVGAAFFLSKVAARPFHRIEDQNRDLEKLNQTIRTQAASMLEEHERVKVMMDANPLASRLWNRNFELIECNDAAVKLFNLKDKQEYIARYFDLSPEYQPNGQSTREKITQSVTEAFEKGRCAYEWMYCMLDGTPIPAETTLVRVPYEDDYVVAAYSRDLREYNKMMAEIEERDAQLEAALAEAKNANSAKTNFLAHMSHEIRTPLNAVIGLSELTLGENNLPREAELNLEKISGAGSTILSIVNDILDISKIESGRLDMYPAKYDTPSLINDIVTLNIVRIGDKPITFKLFADENLPGALYGDDLRVKQIFNNLLSNAFKYTHSGTVEWRISFETDEDSVWLVSSVKDSGIGIKPKDVEKLFSDYNQVDAQTNRRVEGTGLGLAITKRLLEMMDGSITVESEYGKGSTFSVRLRQTLVSDTPIGKEVAENLMDLRYTLSKRTRDTRIARVNMSYAHVLVVDDIPTNLDVVKGMMKPYGMKIDCASSGRQAIEMIRAGNPRYSAVFMDHMMPGMDGVQAARIIREEVRTDYARNIPIIALTANALVGNEEMFLSQGFQDFISKPIEMMKLDAVLRRWVRDKKLEEELSAAGYDEYMPDSGGEGSLLKGIDIDGVDIPSALDRFGGDETALIDVLRSYAANTRPLLSSLREYLGEGNLKDYAIVVHGIKGSSYGISAHETAKAAETLEFAAKSGDAGVVKTGHAAFEKIAESLLDDMDKVLVEIDAAINKPEADQPDPALLEELREACVTYDMDRVDRAMDRINAFRYEDAGWGEFVAWLRKQIDNMAFEEIFSLDLPELPERFRRASRGKREAPNHAAKTKEYLNFTAPDAEILIVDDNETNLKAVLGLLKPLRMRMDTAEHGKEALEMIARKQYHLIFMDRMMPVMDGIEAVKSLRQMEGEYYQNVPVIALTADDTAAEPGAIRESLLQSGMNDIITKPVEMKELCEKIRRWLPGELLREEAPDIEEAPDELYDDLPVIEGIDARKGIRYCGTKELFISLLGNVYKLIDMKADKIEKCLAGGLVRDVTIDVHALKNSARMIGAEELSEGFARLERYGNEGNREALERETPAVLKQYRNFKPLLRPFGEAEERKKRAVSGKELIALLRKLSSSMDSFDLDGADEVIKRLEEVRIPEECRTQMETLRAYVADVAMQETMELAEAMIGIIEKIQESAT